ncbi:MAG TPA: hypothetical protein VGE43_03750 [Acidimicrobiales bacterium]
MTRHRRSGGALDARIEREELLVSGKRGEVELRDRGQGPAVKARPRHRFRCRCY